MSHEFPHCSQVYPSRLQAASEGAPERVPGASLIGDAALVAHGDPRVGRKVGRHSAGCSSPDDGRCAILDGDEKDCPEDDGLLLRVYVPRELVFWHEEIAQLRAFSSDLTSTHRQKMNWLVGFLF
ncbi:MAG: hypothetical protein WBE76_24175 [Terracidiphilus sp.]